MYIFSYLFLSKWLFAYQFQVINKQGATRCALEYITVLACRQDNADVVSSVCQFLRIYCFCLLPALRQAGIGRDCLKAVLTPHNRTWTAVKLYQELLREHQAMNGR